MGYGFVNFTEPEHAAAPISWAVRFLILFPLIGQPTNLQFDMPCVLVFLLLLLLLVVVVVVMLLVFLIWFMQKEFTWDCSIHHPEAMTGESWDVGSGAVKK